MPECTCIIYIEEIRKIRGHGPPYQDWRDTIPRITVPTLYVSGNVGYITNADSSAWVVNAIKGCQWARFGEKEYGTLNLMINAYERFNIPKYRKLIPSINVLRSASLALIKKAQLESLLFKCSRIQMRPVLIYPQAPPEVEYSEQNETHYEDRVFVLLASICQSSRHNTPWASS